MKILITESNKEKIQKELDTVQARCKAQFTDINTIYEYICSSTRYHTCKEFKDRVKRQKKIFVANIPNKTIYIKDTDIISAHFANRR